MFYEKIILDAFKELKIVPRNEQIEIIDLIISSFLNEHKKYFILNANTGIGKSIIGIVVSHIMAKKHDKNEAALIVTSTKLLMDQYEYFMKSNSSTFYSSMKGAANYECLLKKDLNYTAKQCYRRTSIFEKEISDPKKKEFYDKQCGSCLYKKAVEQKNYSRFLVTNYAYHFLDRLFLDNKTNSHGAKMSMKPRCVTVYDEAHLLNDQFVNHSTIFFSKERFTEILQDLENDHATLKAKSWTKAIFDSILEEIQAKVLNETNIDFHLKALLNVYRKISNWYDAKIHQHLDISEYMKFKMLKDKYYDFSCKIDDYFIYEFETVLDIDCKTEQVSIKPIFVKSMFKKLTNSDHVLFMSATISKDLILNTLEIKDEEIGYLKTDQVFNPEDKTVVIDPRLMIKINYQNLDDIRTSMFLSDKVNLILDKHSNQKGIILANSFKLAKEIHKSIKNRKVFLHQHDTDLEKLIKAFKKSDNGILLSPSIFEGIDLPGSDSQFNIFLKAPYPSLSEKRMQHILKKYPTIYKITTIQKIVQGIGRSTRFRGDKSVTYFLDQNLKDLFYSYYNEWQDDFLVLDSYDSIK